MQTLGRQPHIFFRKMFRRRVFHMIVGVSISYHAFKKHHSTHIASIGIPSITYHFNKFPLNTIQYVSIQNVPIQSLSVHCNSIQYVSIQYVCCMYRTSRNGNECEYKTYPCIVCISRNGNECEYKTYPCISTYHCIKKNGREYQIIPHHFISLLLAGNGNEKNVAESLFSLQLCNFPNQ